MPPVQVCSVRQGTGGERRDVIAMSEEEIRAAVASIATHWRTGGKSGAYTLSREEWRAWLTRTAKDVVVDQNVLCTPQTPAPLPAGAPLRPRQCNHSRSTAWVACNAPHWGALFECFGLFPYLHANHVTASLRNACICLPSRCLGSPFSHILCCCCCSCVRGHEWRLPMLNRPVRLEGFLRYRNYTGAVIETEEYQRYALRMAHVQRSC